MSKKVRNIERKKLNLSYKYVTLLKCLVLKPHQKVPYFNGKKCICIQVLNVELYLENSFQIVCICFCKKERKKIIQVFE